MLSSTFHSRLVASKRDIVYFLKEGLPLEGAELRYSLRSLVNLPHRKVWFISPAVPEWVQNIDWIEWPQQRPIYYDLSEKYKALARVEEDMTDDVYVMDDDIYIIKPQSSIPLYNTCKVKEMMSIRANNMSDQFGHALYATHDLMVKMGWGGTMHPCQHSPFPMTRSKIPVHLDDGNGPYEYKTLYHNWHLCNGGKAADMMYRDPKAYDKKTVETVAKRKDGLLSSLEGRHEHVFTVLKKLFPEKGEYEVN